jgi:hypothetical protein
MTTLRHPHTHAERSANADPEVSPFVRGARRPDNLPSDWTEVQPKTGKKKVRYGRTTIRGFVPRMNRPVIEVITLDTHGDMVDLLIGKGTGEVDPDTILSMWDRRDEVMAAPF